MGLVPDELSRAESAALGLDPNVGILLGSIVPEGPAAAAGLQRGDVILGIDGESIRSRQQALLLVARLNPGEQVEIVGWRDGGRFRAILVVAERPELATAN